MIEVRIPKLGMSTVEVDITEVQVHAGDRVEPGQKLIVMESEKVTAHIESEYGGVVTQVLVTKDDVRHVGDVVCLIEEDPE